MTGGFDPGRVVEVWAPAESSGTIGSGYLLGVGLVLTAGHVVDRVGGGRCEARMLGGKEWLPAELEWRGKGCDAALLRIPGADRGGDPHLQLGRLGTRERAACHAVGFPYAQAKEAGEVRDTEELGGEIAPLSAIKGGLLTVHIAGSVPTRDRVGHSPWEGMSGAALFSGPLIVGVVIVHPARFGSDRLEAVPTTAMVAEAGFREALTGDPEGAVNLPAVEDVDIARGVLRDPYRPLPARATPERLRRSATSFLVRPEYGVVPFHGRAEELEQLEEWCTGEAGLEVALLRGAGGTGKTRLAAELCRQSQQEGVLAGFLEGDVPAERIAALADVSASLLVVVDEAHAHIDQVAKLIIQLARAQSDTPLRVLLLARQAGEWWDSALPLRLGGDPDAELAYSAATVPEPLTPVDESVAARERSFRAAADAFAWRMERPVEELPIPGLGQQPFEEILFVHLAALSALERQQMVLEGRVFRQDLLQSALERESRYWADAAGSSGLELRPVALERAVALATLTVAATEDEAASALAAVPDLADASQQRLREAAGWLRDLYPPPATQSLASQRNESPWFAPLTPELLGDALLGRVLETAPLLPTRLLSKATPLQANYVLTRLTQAARIHDSARGALRRALSDHLPVLWLSAVILAQQVGDPLGLVLADVLQQDRQPELASQIVAVLPQHSVSLREVAAVATSQALEAVRDREADVERDAELARLASDLSVRQGALGRHDEALAAIEEAVEICRRLAEVRPDAFVPELARSLLNQSVCVGQLGREEEALAAVGEAVEIYRRLAEASPDAFLPELADSLTNQSAYLSQLVRGEEALTAVEEAVEIYRRLAEARPDAFLPELADSLTNQSASLGQLGSLEEALAAVEEAVETWRRLAEARPDAFLPNLAGSLHNQSNRLRALGRREEALAASEEAVEIRRRLVEARPDAFLPELGKSLSNQSILLGELGRREEALPAVEEAVEIWRRLAEARPDAFLPELGTSLSTQSILLGELGREAEALPAVEEAVEIWRRLAEVRPGAFLPELARSLSTQSILLRTLGRREEALAAVEEAVPVYRRLTEASPDAFLPELARSLSTQPILLGELGRDEEALAAVGEAVEVWRRLNEASPDAFLPELARSLTLQSAYMAELGHEEEKGEEALAAVEEAVPVYRRLAEASPDAFLPALARSLTTQSAYLAQLGREEEALAAVEEAVPVYRRLAEASPEAFVPGLAESLDNQSILLGELGRLEEALAPVEEAVEIWGRLNEASPNAFLPELAGSLDNQSILLGQLGHRKEEVLPAVEHAIGLVLPMLERHPYLLPDAGSRLLQTYLELCEEVQRKPQPEIAERIHRLLGSAGILPREDA
jgi:tetratricopeptide (TPR) repeat protein